MCTIVLVYAMDIKSLHTPDKMAGFYDVKSETELSHVRNIFTIVVKLQHIKNQERDNQKICRGKNEK